MEEFTLDAGMQHISSQGGVLSARESACISAALAKLRISEKYPQVYFWGRISGDEDDYYIAYGLRQSSKKYPNKRFYWTTSGTSFLLSELPSLSTDEAALARTIERGPFRGKPSKVIGLTDEEQEGERAAAEAEQAEKEAAELARKEAAEQKAAELAAAAEAAAAAAAEGVESAPPVEPIQTTATEEDPSQPAANPPKPLRITELQRLAFVVRQMDHETALVPKGAFEVTDSRNVISSGNFRGLSFNESRSLSNYRHLRPASEPERLRAQDEAVHMTEFLDGPEEDTPSGCWVMREDAVSGAVSWRSLLWPGYAAFHIPNTFHYGGAYIGNGVRNSDLAFMLM